MPIITFAFTFAPLYRFVYLIFPMFRVPGRFFLLLAMPFALFTAITFEQLQSSLRYKRPIIVIIGVILSQLGLFAIYFMRTNSRWGELPFVLILASILLWGLIIALGFKFSKATWIKLMVLILLLDTSLHSINLGDWLPHFPSHSDMALNQENYKCLSDYLVDDTSIRLFRDPLNRKFYSMINIRIAAAYGIPIFHYHSSNIRWANDLWDHAPSLLQLNYSITNSKLDDTWQKVKTSCKVDLYKRKEITQSRVYVVNQVNWVENDETLAAVSDSTFD